MKILFIGSYPPPYGGVTIHIQRLTELLFNLGYTIIILDIINKDLKKLKNNVYQIPLNVRYIKSVIYHFFTADIVHIHTSGYRKYWRETLLIAMSKLCNNKVIITIHGGMFPEYVSKSSFISIYFLKFWFKYSDKIVFVNSLQREAVKKYISPKEANKFGVIPAYIPEEKNNQSSNNFVNNEIKFNTNFYKVLVMGNWLELYGFDTFIFAVKKLIDNGVNIKAYILIYISAKPDLVYKIRIESLIKDLSLRDNVIFVPETSDISCVYKAMDIFVRPTNVDGDAMSVREALSFGVPVIASDVCQRPSGVVLFKNNDSDDLVQKLKYVLDNLNSFKTRLSHSEQQKYGEKLVQIYKSLS